MRHMESSPVALRSGGWLDLLATRTLDSAIGETQPRVRSDEPPRRTLRAHPAS